MKQGAHPTKPGWSKPHTHSNRTNLAIFRHDMKCKDCQHYDAINQYLNDITEACLSAGHSNITYSSSPINSGRIPGWSEEVEPLHQKSLFWHQIWNDCGRPHTGIVADCMRRTRASYHYAIRCVKKHREQIIRDRIAESLLRSEEHTSELQSR